LTLDINLYKKGDFCKNANDCYLFATIQFIKCIEKHQVCIIK